jgi:hypothetical protein
VKITIEQLRDRLEDLIDCQGEYSYEHDGGHVLVTCDDCCEAISCVALTARQALAALTPAGEGVGE